MEDIKTPFIEDGLLEYLQRLYPDQAPEPNQTEREIWMNRGAAGVVRHLVRLHKDQRENILGGDDVHR
jgi:hypothetical protein